MKKSQSHSSSGDSGGIGLPHDHVSTQAYPDFAKAAVRANGGQGFVVERNPLSEQWRTWMAYFDRMEYRAFDKRGRPYAVNRGHVYRSLECITVPTEWPYEFDLSAPRAKPIDPGDMPIGPEKRKQLAAMMRGLAAKIGGGRGQPAPIPDARYAQTLEARDQAVAFHERHLAELKARYAAAPLPANDDGPSKANRTTEGQGEALRDF